MLERILDLFAGAARPDAGRDDLQVAVAALLVEAARMDDHFDEEERGAIRGLLARHFDLAPAATQRLLAAAEKAAQGSADLYRFVRRVTDEMDAAERIELVEMLWEVVYADGMLDPQEDALVRRIAGLVHVSDRDRGAARKRVIERRGGSA